MMQSTGLAKEAADAYVDALCAPGALTAALNWYRATDLAAPVELDPITVPTLYVWSTDDVALGRTAAEATARYVTGSYRFEVLTGIDHWIPESAADVLSDLLLDHLADG
jgi:pimeloyl-ACP methyl ester carboxylesterase